MKRTLVALVFLALMLIVLAIGSHAQCAPTWGEGPDIPSNLKVNGVCLPLPNQGTANIPSWYNGQPNTVQVCFDSRAASDRLVNLDYYNTNSYSAATAHRLIYDPALKTGTGCVTVDKIMPGRTYLVVPANCGSNCSNGRYGLRGARFDSGWSVSGYGEGLHQTHGYQFKAPATNPAHALSWSWLAVGPPDVYQGKAANIDLVGLWSDGPAPSWIHATSLKVDGQSCTQARSGAVCGHIKLTFVDGGAEVINAYGNYDVVFPSTGTYANMFEVGGNPTAIQAYCWQQPGCMLRFAADSQAPAGQHTITGSFQATDANMVAMGPAVTLSYTISVLPALPVFVVTAPTHFPPIANWGRWDAVMALYGPAKYSGFKTQNLTAGKYNNDNFSATLTAQDYWSVFNYSGERVAFETADYLKMVVAPWQANHLYLFGDKFSIQQSGLPQQLWDKVKGLFGNCGSTTCGGGGGSSQNVQVVTTPGLSCSSPHTWNATPGQSTDDCGAKATNAGSPDYWNEMAQRVLAQTLAWEVNMPRQSVWQEWNLFPWGTVEAFFRYGDPNAKKALNYLANPLIKTAGVSTQPLIWSYKFVPGGTMRAQPYGTGVLLGNQLVNGTPVITQPSGIDEAKERVDRMLQGLREIRNYNPVESAGNPYPCCISTPAFDLGLDSEELIHACTIQYYKTGSCDPAIPAELLAFADWFYSNEFNQSGADFTTPYTLWTTPAGPRLWNYTGNNLLNMLLAPTYAWLGTMYGDSCTLPTSGKGCFAAADEMASHALDYVLPFQSQATIGAKQYNQLFKWRSDYYRWRTGQMTGKQSGILPTFNTQQTPLPDKMEPFNSWSWPTGYPKCQPGTASVSCQWVTFEPTSGGVLKVAVRQSNGSCGPWLTSGASGPGVFVTGTDDQYLHSASISSGLTTHTTYCYGVGATDLSGNVAFSNINAGNNGPLTFTTQ